jgi:hypothetical protein
VKLRAGASPQHNHSVGYHQCEVPGHHVAKHARQRLVDLQQLEQEADRERDGQGRGEADYNASPGHAHRILSAASTTFFRSMARVIGPTPPGTGDR